jgi:hypothetical protein
MASKSRHFPVHIGTVTHQYDATPVQAAQILTDFGFSPAELYILERLEGNSAVAEYGPQDPVNLDRPEANRFRAVPSGGGRA